ncbi:hypothetical protein ACQEV2_10380 [Streptomyces sp. CA-251387]|uniref:hypothetical protein n=1 Tax=Streptomyces sp. CA-251387 TaxID=3240064 RepID=UPI003D8DC649
MGIRTLHPGTAPAQANVSTEDALSTAPPSVPPFAEGAGTARLPADLMSTLQHTARTLRHRLAHRAHGLAELTRGYLALALTALPRPRPVRTVTVFAVGATGPVTEPRAGSTPDRLQPHPHPHPNPHHRSPGPDATP